MGGIWVQTYKQHKAVDQFIKEQLEEKKLALASDEMHVLIELYQSDKQKATALAKSTGREATSFTPLIDRLEKENLIVREPHPTDRRAILVCLTAAAYNLKPTLLVIWQKCEKEFGGKK